MVMAPLGWLALNRGNSPAPRKVWISPPVFAASSARLLAQVSAHRPRTTLLPAVLLGVPQASRSKQSRPSTSPHGAIAAPSAIWYSSGSERDQPAKHAHLAPTGNQRRRSAPGVGCWPAGGVTAQAQVRAQPQRRSGWIQPRRARSRRPPALRRWSGLDAVGFQYQAQRGTGSVRAGGEHRKPFAATEATQGKAGFRPGPPVGRMR